MPTYKSTHISVCTIKKRCEIYTILFKNSSHQFFHNTIDLHFCYSNCANMCGYYSFVSKYFINSSFHLSPSLFCSLLYNLSHINAASTTTHHNPPPTSPHHHHNSQPITKFDLNKFRSTHQLENPNHQI